MQYEIRVGPSCAVDIVSIREAVSGKGNEIVVIDCKRDGDVGQPYCRVTIQTIGGGRYEGRDHRSYAAAATRAAAQIPVGR